MPYGSVTARNFILEAWLGSGKKSGAPTTLYFALLRHATTPATVLGTEATGGSYARVGILNTDSLWDIVNEAATTLVDVQWPVSTASWNASPLNQWAVFDAASAGNCWAFDALTTPIDVSVAGRLPTALAGTIVLTQGE